MFEVSVQLVGQNRRLTRESSIAAWPQHMAVGLWLTVHTLNFFKEAMPPNLPRRSLPEKYRLSRKAEGFPQCAAAKPQGSTPNLLCGLENEQFPGGTFNRRLAKRKRARRYVAPILKLILPMRAGRQT